ncbi:hypothetical protein AHF37_08550 [Paragonimus kellicotti]|nr:hypothetical protein AHF37_08550 [Paragonimus kellicotti]
MYFYRANFHPTYTFAPTYKIVACFSISLKFLGDIGQVDQLGIVGKSHNRLVLADASHHLKLFTNPCGLASSEQTGSWNCHLVPGGHTDVITDLTVSSCGEWIASGSKDQSICLWHVVERDFVSETSKGPDVQVVLGLRLSPAHGAHISALCFNKLTTLLVSASEDMVLKAWTVDVFQTDNSSPQSPSNSCPNLSEWSVVHAAHKAIVNDIDVSVNNQLIATASRDKTLKVFLPHFSFRSFLSAIFVFFFCQTTFVSLSLCSRGNQFHL